MSFTSEEMLTASAAARLLGVSETAIRKRIKSGTIFATKEGNTWCIPREEVERLQKEPNPSRTSEPNTDRTFDSNRTEPDSNGSIHHKVDLLQTQVEFYERENTQLGQQIEYLQTQNDHLTQLLAIAQKSIQQLTDQNQLLLEDTRKKVPWWQRIFGDEKPSSPPRHTDSNSMGQS